MTALLPYLRQFAPKFRGEIWENTAGVPMGKGYANKGRPFDIESACYLKPVFQAILNPAVRKVVIRGAVQCLKTFVSEESSAFFIQHQPGDMAFYDCDAESANDHAKSRLMHRLKSIPGIAEMLKPQLINRFDVTNTELYLPGMTLRIWPLNENAVQRISLRYVIISDAFLSKRTGLIEQAIARTTQHPLDKKIIIESQGGEDGDDFDKQWRDTNQQALHVVCPLCNASQPFEWTAERDGNKFAGMQKGTAGEEWKEADVRRNTHYECCHCGGRWDDKPEVRAALDRSSHYVATNPNALPENVGFTWPAWINSRLSWGDIMLQYLKAKRADNNFGDRNPLIQWYQKRAAKSWRDDLSSEILRVSNDQSYDPAIEWVKEWRRAGWIDVQIHASHMWVSLDAIASDGESHQLFWGCVTSFDEIERKHRELRIQHNRMFIDYGHESELVKSQCFIRGKFFQAKGERRETWHGWNMLTSSRYADLWRTERSTGRKYKDIVSDPEMYSTTIDGKRREVFRFNFSATACGDMFRRFRDGVGVPQMQYISEGPGSEKNELSYVAQIHARFRSVEVDKRTGKKVPIWKPKRHMIPDHGFAIGQMRMAVYRIWNLGGVAPVIPEQVDTPL